MNKKKLKWGHLKLSGAVLRYCMGREVNSKGQVALSVH